MDIWVAKAFHAAAIAFPVVWLVAGIGGITLGLQLDRRPRKRQGLKRIGKILAVPVVVSYLLLLGCLGLTQDFATKHRFASFVAHPPAVLVISSERGAMTISSTETVAELLQIIERGNSVSAHHSHTVDELHLTFRDAGYTYTLGKDSDHPGEFWLTWSGYPGSGPPRHIANVRQFHSDELKTWLDTHVAAGGCH